MDRVERSRQLLAYGLVFAAASLGLAVAEAQGPLPTAKPAPANAAPFNTAPLVESFEVPQDRLAEVVQELRRRFPAASGVRLASDERTRRILAVAPTDRMIEVRAAIRDLLALVAPAPATKPLPPIAEPAVGLQPRVVQEKEIRYTPRERPRGELIVELVRALPRRVSGGVTPTGEGRFTLQGPQLQLTQLAFSPAPVGAAEELILKGPADIVEGWRDLLVRLDVRRDATASADTKLVSLERADRQQVQATLLALQGRLAGENAEAAAAVKPRWGGDMVAMIFQPGEAAAAQPGGAQPPPAAAAQPNPAQPNAGQPGDQAGAEIEGGPFGNVQVQVLEGLGVIILRGKKQDVERAMQIIAEIERLSAENKPTIEILPLHHVDGEPLAALVGQLYDSVLSSRQSSVSITPLVKPNSLLLIGQQEAVQSVIDLVKRLDQPVPPATQFEVFLLRNANAADIEAMINQFYSGRTGLGPRVRVYADYRISGLIVQAARRDLDEVRQLIARTDVRDSLATDELRVFPLKNILADELAPILQEALTGARRGGQGQNQINQQGQQGQPQPAPAPTQGGNAAARAAGLRSAMLTFAQIDTKGRKIIRSGILSNVRVTSDPRGNQLMVTGPADGMDLIAALIAQLDRPPAAEAQIKVFSIINGDATSLSTMLSQLFGLTTGQGGAQNAFQPVLQTAGGDTTLVRLRFSVDQRTNSIIASGSAGDLAVVEAILLRLDESEVRQRQNAVYRLKSAPATDVANSVNEFLRSQRQVQQLFPQAASPFEQIEREVIVVAEPVSNSLIISATPRYFTDVMKIVEQLDSRPPMVMIQVLIAELRLDNTDEFGVELGLQDSLLFDRSVVAANAVTPGFNFNGQPLGNAGSAASLATRNALAAQGITNFATSRTNSRLGYGGLVLSAASDSVNILIRALQDRQKLQVLSRPQVMTLDNQPAFVQVGQRVPRITSSQLTQTGTVNNTVLENVGIILGVTPRIAPDGMVVMEIDAERSELGPTETGIPISINQNGDVIRSPIINTITAQTTVSSRSGQTVILGGLITRSRTANSRRVPWVSDIPVVGHAFRFDSMQETRNELLIIMTPYIVRRDEDIDALKAMESSRMHWCMADVVEVHGHHGLMSAYEGQKAGDCYEVYPDDQPTAGELIPTPGPGPMPLPNPTMGPGPNSLSPTPAPPVPNPPQAPQYLPDPNARPPLTAPPAIRREGFSPGISPSDAQPPLTPTPAGQESQRAAPAYFRAEPVGGHGVPESVRPASYGVVQPRPAEEFRWPGPTTQPTQPPMWQPPAGP